MNWNPKELAEKVVLIGDTTPPFVDLVHFMGYPHDSFATADFVILPYKEAKPIEAADVYLEIKGQAMPLLLGYEYQLPDGRKVYSYDHHGPDIRMNRQVSSASLACQQMLRGSAPFSHAFGTHTDADSILSFFILLTGSTDIGLCESAIAADHTGAENPIADALQAVSELRDLELSFTCLQACLEEKALPDKAVQLLETRLHDRARALKYVREGVIQYAGHGVYVGKFEAIIPGELFPALLPDAKVIVLVSSLSSGFKEIKVRAGLMFPEGHSLNLLGLTGYGGRWNAGSTKRFGGTPSDAVDSFINYLLAQVAADPSMNL